MPYVCCTWKNRGGPGPSKYLGLIGPTKDRNGRLVAPIQAWPTGADVLRLFVDMGGLNERGQVSWETVVGYLREAALNTDDVQIGKLVETLLALEERKYHQHEIEAEAVQRKR